MRLHGTITEVPTAWGSKFVAQLYRQNPAGIEIKIWELGFGSDSLARTSLEAEVKRIMTPSEQPQVIYDRSWTDEEDCCGDGR